MTMIVIMMTQEQPRTSAGPVLHVVPFSAG